MDFACKKKKILVLLLKARKSPGKNVSFENMYFCLYHVVGRKLWLFQIARMV